MTKDYFKDAKIVTFKDIFNQKDKNGNTQIHKTPIVCINNINQNINKVLEQKPVADASIEKDKDFINLTKDETKHKVFDYYFEQKKYAKTTQLRNNKQINKVVFMHSKLKEIELSKKGIKDSFTHSSVEDGVLRNKNKAIAFKYLDKIIENGIPINQEINWKDRGYNTYLLASNINIDNKEYIVEYIVKDNQNNKKDFYLHNVIEKELFSRLHAIGLHLPNNSLPNDNIQNLNGQIIKSHILNFAVSSNIFLQSLKMEQPQLNNNTTDKSSSYPSSSNNTTITTTHKFTKIKKDFGMDIMLVISFLSLSLFLLSSCSTIPISPPQREQPQEITTQNDILFEKFIYFDFNSSEITSYEYNTNIKLLGLYMFQNPNISITLNGYCDIVGTHNYNRRLGEQRAERVKRALVVGYGIRPNRINIRSYGNDYANRTSNEDIRKYNRKVEIEINDNREWIQNVSTKPTGITYITPPSGDPEVKQKHNRNSNKFNNKSNKRKGEEW
jgi:flagellar motor protein MotB